MGRPSTRAVKLSASVLCAALAAVLAGCGGGARERGASSPSPAPASHTAKAGRTPAGGRTALLTKARALAFAHAVNLTLADVPEARVAARKRSRLADAERRDLGRCEGPQSGHRELASVRSPNFQRGSELETEEIYSDVTALDSSGESARNLARLDSAAARRCLARVLSKSFAGKPLKGGQYGGFLAYRLPVSAPGSDGSAGVRLTTTLLFPGPEVTVPLYVDVMAFARGPAEVALITVSATQPVPAGTQQQLLSLLRKRAMGRAL